MIIALSLACLIAGVGLIVLGHPGIAAYGLISASVAGVLASVAYRQNRARQLQPRRDLPKDHWQAECAKLAQAAPNRR
jgi:hypothetical protein